MASLALRKSLLPLYLVILFLAACGDDDPVSPGAPSWQEVDLTGNRPGSRLMAVEFHGAQGLALGEYDHGKRNGDRETSNFFFHLGANGRWQREDLVDLPAGAFFLDLAFDDNGRYVLAGYQFSPLAGLVFDTRGDDPVSVTDPNSLLLSVESDGPFMVAGGRSQGGSWWTSTGPGTWKVDDLTPPLTGTNDSGFQDIAIRGDLVVACGYDDGADTLQVILKRTSTTEWTKVTTAGPTNRTFRCLALSENGTIFVGGSEAAGGPSSKAFLAQRLSDGRWTDLVLPDPEVLHRVQDILISSNGSIYLACTGNGSQTQANLLRASSSGVRKEITPFPGGLLQLSEADNGDIYAVGFRRDEATGVETAVMLRKTP